MFGRWGGRTSTKAGQRDLAMDGQDASPETIAKVRALYDRPGTPGEKAAAAAALRRFGVEPEAKPAATSSSFSYSKPRTYGPKQYRVTITYTTNVGSRTEEIVLEAIDEIDAEAKARNIYRKKYYVSDIIARARRA